MSSYENKTKEDIIEELERANSKIPNEYKNKYKITFEYDPYWEKPMFVVRKYQRFLLFKWSSIMSKNSSMNYSTAFNADFHIQYTINEDIKLDRIMKISKELKCF